MIKTYLRLRWGAYLYHTTHPLVTPAVWWSAALMLVMFVLNLWLYISDLTSKPHQPTELQTRVVKEFFQLPDSKGIVNLAVDLNSKDK